MKRLHLPNCIKTSTVPQGLTDNSGKYVLAVGKKERFPPAAMARTLVTLPRLKRYFGKSPLTAYFNLSGVFLVVTIGAVAGLAALIF